MKTGTQRALATLLLSWALFLGAPLAAADTGSALTVIEGNGRTLMPGLIDNHGHTMLARPSPTEAIEGDLGYLNLLASVEAEATLMRGPILRTR